MRRFCSEIVIPWVKQHRLFWFCLAGYAIFFVIWLSVFHPWSAWLGGDAQSLSTLRFWVRDGYWHHHGLFLVQGYSPFAQLLEQPSLWQHGLASIRTDGQTVAQSIYYNHYPTAYLLPLYFVCRLIGTVSLLPLQVTQLLISLAALAVTFFTLRRFAALPQALAASAVAGFSWLFTDFAFSLNNLPLDELFRWSFILLTLLEKTTNRRRLVQATLWIVYFLLASVSLDAIVFCGIWLAITDLLSSTRSWKLVGRWALFACAPILAQFLQFLQSVHAWGWRAAVLDRTTSFSSRSIESGTLSWFIALKQRLYAWSISADSLWFGNLPTFHGSRLITCFILATCLSFLGYLLVKHRASLSEINRQLAEYASAAFIAGLGFASLVPVAGYMRYQGRQLLPFFLFFLILIGNLFKEPFFQNQRPRWLLRFFAVGVSILSIFMIASGIHTFIRKTPQVIFGQEPVTEQRTQFTQLLQSQATNPRQAVFLLDPTQEIAVFIDTSRSSFSYQLPPLLSYQTDRLILAFQSQEQLIRDFQELRRLSQNQVIPLIISHDPLALDTLAAQAGVTCPSHPASPIRQTNGFWHLMIGSECPLP